MLLILVFTTAIFLVLFVLALCRCAAMGNYIEELNAEITKLKNP